MKNTSEINPKKHSVHRILAHSYSVYFLFFLVGVCLDFIFNLKAFNSTLALLLGLLFIVLATVLIFWAQKTSRNLNVQNLSPETFCKGPYCYTRSPTHWGLFFLMIGFGLVANAIFVILFTLIAFLVTRFVFLKKEEMVLENKYGAPYTEYKKAVKN